MVLATVTERTKTINANTNSVRTNSAFGRSARRAASFYARPARVAEMAMAAAA